MPMHFKTLAWLALFVSLAGADRVHSAGAHARASATIVAASNDATAISGAFTQMLFSQSTGVLTIRIPGAPARSVVVASVCGWAMSGGAHHRCNAPLTWQVLNDGTLNGQQGVSLSFTREGGASSMVVAMLAYN
jgi:hypothetical protein